MTKRQSMIFLGILMSVMTALCFFIARPFVAPAVFALLLAVGFYPIHNQVLRWVRQPSLAAGLSTVIISLILLVPLAFVVTTVITEAQVLYGEAQSASEDDGGIARYFLDRVRDAAAWISPRLQVRTSEIVEHINGRLEEAASWLGKGLALGVWVTGAVVVDFCLAALMLFFLLRDGVRIRRALVDVVPLKKSDSEHLLRVIGDTLEANLYGVVGVALLQGFLAGLGFVIAGIPSPFTWGVVAAFFAMLPFVGTVVVWGPVAIWLAATDAWGWAIFLVLWGMLVTGLADNLVRPMIVGERTHQHPMLVFLSIFGGLSAFGPVGLFLGPLVVSVTAAVFDVFRRRVSAGGEYGLRPYPRAASGQ